MLVPQSAFYNLLRKTNEFELEAGTAYGNSLSDRIAAVTEWIETIVDFRLLIADCW